MAKRIEFELPEGLSLPDGISKSGSFEVLATLQLKDDGKACLKALDGYLMPGYQEKDSDDKSYASAASEGMPESY